MKRKQSAGILLYRFRADQIEFLLVHPGGPFHVYRDVADWSIPKGEFDETENALNAAKREFAEELGHELEVTDFIELRPIKQKSGKKVFAWAAEGEFDTATVKSNMFQLEHPAKSGKFVEVPEVDRAEWFDLKTAKQKINPAQTALLEELVAILSR